MKKDKKIKQYYGWNLIWRPTDFRKLESYVSKQNKLNKLNKLTK